MREIGRLVLVLVLICVVAGGGLAYVRQALAGRIEMQSDFYVRGPALARLLGQPADELLANKIKLTAEDVEYPVFFLADGDEIRALAVEALGRGGYGGDIRLMVGIDLTDDKMLGMEIIAHSETPGLGSAVAKEAFRAQWKGLSATSPAALGAGIDAISGATYSSRAVVDGTNRVVALVGAQRDEILAAIAARRAAGKEATP